MEQIQLNSSRKMVYLLEYIVTSTYLAHFLIPMLSGQMSLGIIR
jgi:hypothetical protein